MQNGPRDYLRIYMNDQLALGIAWRETARRAARENRGTPLGAALASVAHQISEDVATFGDIMQRLGMARSTIKPALAMAAERVGRLKPNGHLRSYSPLSRFVELDFLVMGIEGKKILWENLRDLAGIELTDVDFDALIDRADEQRRTLEPFHREAGREALALTPSHTGDVQGVHDPPTGRPPASVVAETTDEPETLADEPGSVPPVGGG